MILNYITSLKHFIAFVISSWSMSYLEIRTLISPYWRLLFARRRTVEDEAVKVRTRWLQPGAPWGGGLPVPAAPSFPDTISPRAAQENPEGRVRWGPGKASHLPQTRASLVTQGTRGAVCISLGRPRHCASAPNVYTSQGPCQTQEKQWPCPRCPRD